MVLREFRVAARAAACLAAAFALGGCLGPTYGTGKTQGEQLVSDLDGMLSLGSSSEKTPISYTPRAELVKPKDTSVLPPPRDSVNAANDPNWPESPEVRSARIKAAADAIDSDGVIPAEVALADKEGITRAQMAANTRGNMFNGRAIDEIGGSDRPLTPGELNGSSASFRAKLRESRQGLPTQRKYLSEPPLAYRQPAATAPVGDPGVDERVKEARLKKDGGFGDKLRSLLPF